MDIPSHHTGLTRRAALGTLAAGAVGAAVWPRTPRSRADIPSGRTVIDYWEKWTGPEGDAVQRVVDRFNAEQSRVWVRRTAVSEIDTKAMVAIGGGDPPDVVGVFSYNVPQYARSGAAMPLGSFGDASTRIDPGIYVPAVRKLLTYRGEFIAGITSLYSLALYYNRAMFKEVGLDPDAPPRTVPELDAAAERLLVRQGTAIARAGLLQNLPLWWPYFWPVMFGGVLYDPEKDRAVFDDAATIAAYEWVASYPKRLGVAASEEFGVAYNRSFHSPQDPFIAGRVAMIVQGPWLANFINHYGPHLDYGVAPIPVTPGIFDDASPHGMLEADVLMIPRGCRHPEEAFEFVRFTQRQDVQEQLAREHTKSSPLVECSKEFFVGHPNKCVGVFDAITRSKNVLILPQTPVWKSYAHLTEGAFDAVWRGEHVPAVCGAVQRRAQEMIDKAARVEGLRRARG
ncbi:MAG: extracellular solute-binding protein [Planctomycetes bacterium]|nr:extracellular solute-binding protein [Planctomycetota bacterium]